MIDVFEINT